MNYMALKRCVESGPYAPIQQQWLDSIVARVLPELKEGPDKKRLLQALCEEVCDDFHNVIVKHTGTAKYLSMLSEYMKLQLSHPSLCHAHSL